MAVSQHDREASTPRGAQFDSFSRSQGPPQNQELHGWSPSSPHSHRWRVPGLSRNRLASVKKAHFVAGEYGGATLRIYGVAVGPRGRTYCVQSPNWTPGWGCRKEFQRSLWSQAAVLSTWTRFLDCHELFVSSDTAWLYDVEFCFSYHVLNCFQHHKTILSFKGTDHGLTTKLDIYTKINKYI
jgi:hypothetical protein